MQKKIAIIGAGLTGLTTAFYLKKAGIDFVVLEKANRAGGVIETKKQNGFVMEAGPNTGVLGNPEATELLEDLAEYCELEVADEEAKRRLILKNGRWHDLPSGLLGGITTPLFSWYDKFRLLGEPFRTKGTNPHETLADLVKRRMGQSFLDYAIDPFILGIYSGDPARLVPKYALPKLYNLEQDFGSFIGGAIKKGRLPKTDRDKKATREVFSVKGGLSNLVSALTQAVGEENIILNAENMVISRKENGYQLKWNNQGIEAEKVITTVGAHALPELLPFVSEEELNPITQLNYARVVEVTMGFKKWDGINVKAFGGLIPFKEKRDILGVLFLSSFLKDRAPQDGVLLTVFVGGVRRDELNDLSDEELMKLVKREVMDLMEISEFKPEAVGINRYQHAIPQYYADSGERFKQIEKLQKEYPNLIIAGNLRDGIGMADRIKQGRTIAEQLAE
ncbi:protoporphyrinogen oxidase [Prolixibacteraceae bacterium JC049]|nr:protoporphyrinogen oxidase [Prolixibacteraceae bacterium JC049]